MSSTMHTSGFMHDQAERTMFTNKNLSKFQHKANGCDTLVWQIQYALCVYVSVLIHSYTNSFWEILMTIFAFLKREKF